MVLVKGLASLDTNQTTGDLDNESDLDDDLGNSSSDNSYSDPNVKTHVI
jgi:hypothetical protein